MAIRRHADMIGLAELAKVFSEHLRLFIAPPINKAGAGTCFHLLIVEMIPV
jgi:hypothetical protein